MTGFKIKFCTGGAVIDLCAEVQDFYCLVQNALVNLGCVAGSDRVYPAKGTRLLLSAIQGALIDLSTAGHASNFAALSTLQFIQATDYSDNPNGMRGLILSPASFSRQSLVLDAQFAAVDGTVTGVVSTLSTA